jgi:hypothetical protein
VPKESTTPAPEAVVLASFENRRAAERMLAALGRDFRKKARKGDATAFVISGNEDGSLKITESRVLEAGDFTAVVIRLSLSWAIGFMGIYSTLRGSLGGVRAARKHHGHVGSDDQRAHEILEEVGPHAAIALMRCKGQEMCRDVDVQAADRAIRTWTGSLTEFLAALDPGTRHDWVRTALGQPVSS